ncbi:MAG: glycerate kinase [Pseudobutyrivibrio sp.]|nr:glycerate kinase [Pseudobutyrivibrio sp.]
MADKYNLRSDADIIIKESIAAVLPDEAVKKALEGKDFSEGRVFLVAAGKAGWQMAKAASELLKDNLYKGVVVTKYDHVKGDILNTQCFEAGHPVPDENSFLATQKAIDLVSEVTANDTVIFLLSGGGSALFEKPLVSGEELADITKQLLSCGADIVEMNTVRKRLSAVKGGKFAKLCEPAKVFSIVLSDILGDPLDMIASGPAYPDSSSCDQALAIAEKYRLKLSDEALACLKKETPKELKNVETMITGSVSNLCQACADSCLKLGYEPVILTDMLTCEAKEAGAFLSAIAKTWAKSDKSMAFIAGGETVVHLKGNGKGGRNQEIALSAAEGIAGIPNVAVFSVGSDGTDGPCDAAGGFTDGSSKENLLKKGVLIYDVLNNNDAYNALKLTDGLIITGATGTNVNDVSVVLIKA